MRTSDKGVAALEREEGVVLKAYRDVVGVWTIGAGLTAASGVVRPKAGMTITREQATTLLKRALAESYEPIVGVTMASVSGSKVIRPKQHEFDAGVSFHFNTGAIRKASWVKLWKGLAPRKDVRRAMLMWNKGGGRVLPGLTARRGREAAMLIDGQYIVGTPMGATAVLANVALLLSPSELQEVRAAFRKLGYDPGSDPAGIKASTVVRFQRDHDLTDDGIIGRATLSTLQRRLDAPAAAAKPAVAAPLAAAATTDAGASIAHGLGMTGAEWLALGLVGFWALSTAWRYRDVIAAKIARPAPRLATFLRSF